jgi:hypothetical protein
MTAKQRRLLPLALILIGVGLACFDFFISQRARTQFPVYAGGVTAGLFVGFGCAMLYRRS